MLADLRAVPDGTRERALAVVVAAHEDALAREARWLAGLLGATGTDRASAARLVGAVQRALLHDVAAGRRALDARSWSPTVLFEAARAARQHAAAGTLATAPYRHRRTADRAALLALRQAASVPEGPGPSSRSVHAGGPATVPAAPVVAPVLAASGVPARATARLVADREPLAAAVRTVAGVPAPRDVTVPRPRTVRSSPPARRRAGATTTARWGAAALLSAVTLVLGATIAPAEDRPTRSPALTTTTTPGGVVDGTVPGWPGVTVAGTDPATGALTSSLVHGFLAAPVLTAPTTTPTTAPGSAPTTPTVETVQDESRAGDAPAPAVRSTVSPVPAGSATSRPATTTDRAARPTPADTPASRPTSADARPGGDARQGTAPGRTARPASAADRPSAPSTARSSRPGPERADEARGRGDGRSDHGRDHGNGSRRSHDDDRSGRPGTNDDGRPENRRGGDRSDEGGSRGESSRHGDARGRSGRS